MQAVFDHSQKEGSNIQTFFFKPERTMQYTAGQFAEWRLPHPNPDSRGTRRWFTISSSPNDEFITFSTRIQDKAGSSFKHALATLQPGDEIQVSDAMGDFVLPKLIQTPLLFVAGGIGITPFHSILSGLAQTGEERDIKMLHAVRNEDDIIFQDTFEKAGVKPTIIVDQPSSAWGGERGQLSAEKIIGLGQPAEDSLIYISGPEPLVEKLEKDLTKAGINKSQLVLDFFPNYPEY